MLQCPLFPCAGGGEHGIDRSVRSFALHRSNERLTMEGDLPYLSYRPPEGCERCPAAIVSGTSVADYEHCPVIPTWFYYGELTSKKVGCFSVVVLTRGLP